MVCSYFINRKKANAKTMSVKVRSHRTSALTYPIFFIFIQSNNRMTTITRCRSLELAPHPTPPQGCARFAETLQNFSESQILLSLWSVVFCTLTLRLPIQTSLSVAPKLQVSLNSREKCPNFRKRVHPSPLHLKVNYEKKSFYLHS